MFVGFDLSIDKKMHNFVEYYKYGKGLYKEQKRLVNSELASYVDDKGILNATLIEEDWFPSIDSDVFISHSHMDEDLAIGFAGWLNKEFRISSFIDSCVWGYANDLLKIIDNKYCVKEHKSDNTGYTYDYNKRNLSTSHVHMILNTALQKMIDKVECLMFINTQNSLSVDDVINGTTTTSPWIYSELTFSRICRKKKLNEYRTELEHSMAFEHTQFPNIKYDVSVSDLIKLDIYDLFQIHNNGNPYRALDELYMIKELLDNEEL